MTLLIKILENTTEDIATQFRTFKSGNAIREIMSLLITISSAKADSWYFDKLLIKGIRQTEKHASKNMCQIS